MTSIGKIVLQPATPARVAGMIIATASLRDGTNKNTRLLATSEELAGLLFVRKTEHITQQSLNQFAVVQSRKEKRMGGQLIALQRLQADGFGNRGFLLYLIREHDYPISPGALHQSPYNEDEYLVPLEACSIGQMLNELKTGLIPKHESPFRHYGGTVSPDEDFAVLPSGMVN